MVFRILSRGAIAAVAGAVDARRLERALARLHALLAITRTAGRQRRRSVRLVAWRLARWLAWRLASWMGLASQMGMGRRLASLGLGWGGAPVSYGFGAGLPLLVGPMGFPSLRRFEAA